MLLFVSPALEYQDHFWGTLLGEGGCSDLTKRFQCLYLTPDVVGSSSKKLSSKATDQLLQEYVLNRLIRGAGSGQGAARQGFASALACLLTTSHPISTPTVLQTAQKHLACTSSMKPSVRFSTVRRSAATHFRKIQDMLILKSTRELPFVHCASSYFASSEMSPL